MYRDGAGHVWEVLWGARVGGLLCPVHGRCT